MLLRVLEARIGSQQIVLIQEVYLDLQIWNDVVVFSTSEYTM